MNIREAGYLVEADNEPVQPNTDGVHLSIDLGIYLTSQGRFH